MTFNLFFAQACPLSSLACVAYILKIRMVRETTPQVLQCFVCSIFLGLRNYSTFVQEPPLTTVYCLGIGMKYLSMWDFTDIIMAYQDI